MPIPLGECSLNVLIQTLSMDNTKFYLGKKYEIESSNGMMSFYSSKSSPKHVLQPIIVDDNTDMNTFNESLGSGEDIDLCKDFDLFVPIGKKYSSNPLVIAVKYIMGIPQVYGHFVLLYVRKRGNYIEIAVLDSKRDEGNDYITEKILSITQAILENHFSECKVITEPIYCSVQKTEDSINCGYYIFKMIYNFLLLGTINDKDYIDIVCPGSEVIPYRYPWESIVRLLSFQSEIPYSYEDVTLNRRVSINYLTHEERDIMSKYAFGITN